MVRLKDLMGTYYMTVNLASALQAALNSVTEPVDLTGCKFTPKLAEILKSYYGKIEFHNSSNAELERVCLHNNAAAAVTGNFIPLELTYTTSNEFVSLFASLKTGVVYDLSYIPASDFHRLKYAVALIVLRKPEITLNLGTNLGELLGYIRRFWLMSRTTSYPIYQEVDGSIVWEREVVDGKVYIPGVGNLDEESYVREFRVLPSIVGKEDLHDSYEFKEVWEDAIKNLVPKKAKRISLKTYIEIR